MATQKKFVVKNGLISQSNVDITGNITVSGTVDGRDISTDGTKLDGIPAAANVYTDANVNTYLGANGYGTSASIIASITASAPATLDTLNDFSLQTKIYKIYVEKKLGNILDFLKVIKGNKDWINQMTIEIKKNNK